MGSLNAGCDRTAAAPFFSPPIQRLRSNSGAASAFIWAARSLEPRSSYRHHIASSIRRRTSHSARRPTPTDRDSGYPGIGALRHRFLPPHSTSHVALWVADLGREWAPVTVFRISPTPNWHLYLSTLLFLYENSFLFELHCSRFVIGVSLFGVSFFDFRFSRFITQVSLVGFFRYSNFVIHVFLFFFLFKIRYSRFAIENSLFKFFFSNFVIHVSLFTFRYTSVRAMHGRGSRPARLSILRKRASEYTGVPLYTRNKTRVGKQR